MTLEDVCASRYSLRRFALLPCSALLFVSSCALPVFFPDYRVIIQRRVVEPGDEQIIAAAEAACPSYEQVLAAFQGAPPAPAPDCLWWYREIGGVRIPYAVTGEAVAYYAELIDTWRSQSRVAHGHLEYEASVRRLDGDEAAHVAPGTAAVYLRMELNLRDNDSIAAWVRHDRIVLVDESLQVVGVFGDRPAQVPIFKSDADPWRSALGWLVALLRG